MNISKIDAYNILDGIPESKIILEYNNTRERVSKSYGKSIVAISERIDYQDNDFFGLFVLTNKECGILYNMMFAQVISI